MKHDAFSRYGAALLQSEGVLREISSLLRPKKVGPRKAGRSRSSLTTVQQKTFAQPSTSWGLLRELCSVKFESFCQTAPACSNPVKIPPVCLFVYARYHFTHYPAFETAATTTPSCRGLPPKGECCRRTIHLVLSSSSAVLHLD